VAKKKKFRLLLPRWPLPLLKPLRPLPPLLVPMLVPLLVPLLVPMLVALLVLLLVPLLVKLLLPLRLKLPSNSWQAAEKTGLRAGFFSPARWGGPKKTPPRRGFEQDI